MFNIIKVEKNKTSYKIYVEKYTIQLCLLGELKNREMHFTWQWSKLNLNNRKDIIKKLVQESEDESDDAAASAIAYLEKINMIRVDDYGNIFEVEDNEANC